MKYVVVSGGIYDSFSFEETVTHMRIIGVISGIGKGVIGTILSIEQ
jgi:hypothetical protein